MALFRHYSEDLEKKVSAIFGLIGLLAILLKLFFSGISPEALFDAIANAMGLIVTVAVFYLASRLYRKMSFQDFAGKFEEYLHDWAEQNKYLIDTKSAERIRGKEGKRSYSMLLDLSNVVTAEKPASEFPDHPRVKGEFLYLPTEDQMKGELKESITFRFNQTTFKRQEKFTELPAIVEQFAKRINKEFGKQPLNIEAVIPQNSQPVIEVSLKPVEKTEENARRLIDLVEFTKTMVLALA